MFGPKNENFKFHLKFGTWSNSYMKNLMVMSTFFVFEKWKYLFYGNFVSKNQNCLLRADLHLVTCMSVLLRAHFPTWMEMHLEQFCVHKKSCIQKILIYEGLFVASTIQISSLLVSSLLTTWLETPKPTKTTKKMTVGQLVLSWKISNYQTKRWYNKIVQMILLSKLCGEVLNFVHIMQF